MCKKTKQPKQESQIQLRLSVSMVEEDKVYILFVLIFGVLSPLSAISWRPVLVVEEDGVTGENH